MASTDKSSMPELIFVIFSGYEVRYYTTIETFAAAITDGYADGVASQVKCFVPAEWADDKIDQAVLGVAKKKPFQFRQSPNWHKVMNPQSLSLHQQMTGAYVPPTPAQEKFLKDEKNRQRKERKKHKDAIVADLTAALGRKV